MSNFDTHLEVFCGWLWRTSWQVSILILAILFTQWALRKYLSPRTRYALWLLVLVRLALPTLPESPFSLFNLIPQPEAVVASVSRSWTSERPILNSSADRPLVEETGQPQPASGVHPSPIENPSEGSNSVAAAPNTSTRSLGPANWWRSFALLWSAGALLFTAFLVGQSMATRSWYKRLATKTDPELENLLEECKRQVGVTSPIRLAQAPERTSPALMGYWRPTLLLPEGIVATIGRENLRYVFTHELAHLKRRDILANWIATFFGLLHWFNPVVWYAFRRMRTDQELACDHQALSYIGQEEKKRYSETILALFERVVLPQRLPGMAGILEDKSLMKRRIQMIVDFKKPGPAWTAVTVAVSLALALSTLTGATTTETEIPEPVAERSISLPPDQVVGSVFIRDWGSSSEEDWEQFGDAVGTVVIPEKKEVRLSTGGKKLENYSFLQTLAPNDIQSLDFENSPITESGLAFISGFTALRELNLAHTKIPGDGLRAIQNLQTLEWIGLEETGITGEGLSFLSGLSNLHHLDFYLTKLDDDSMAHLSGLTNLKWLGLEETGLTGACLVHLKGLRNLEGLNVEKNDLSQGDFESLVGLTNLKTLLARNVGLKDIQVQAIGRIASLEDLNISLNPITDAAIESLAGLSNLRTLNLAQTNVTDSGLAGLTRLPELRKLILQDAPTTEEGIRALASLPKIEDIAFNRNQFTAESFAKFNEFSPLFAPHPEAPKVGVLFSLFSDLAHDHETAPFQSQIKMAKMFIRNHLNVWALIDPDSEGEAGLTKALAEVGLLDKILDSTRLEDLLTLDAIGTDFDRRLTAGFLNSLEGAIQNGVGLYNYSIFGNRDPGYTDQIQRILGIRDPRYNFRPGFHACPILKSHPILGVLEPGERFWINTVNGYAGLVDGEQLVGAPEGVDPDFCPLYVREYGEGRIVNLQWFGYPRPSPPYQTEEICIRCINWVAKRPVGEKWEIEKGLAEK